MQQSLAIVIGVKNESQKETLESLGACVCKLFHFVRKLHLVFMSWNQTKELPTPIFLLVQPGFWVKIILTYDN